MSSKLHRNRKALILEIASATLANGGVAVKLEPFQFLPPMDVWAFPNIQAGLRFFRERAI